MCGAQQQQSVQKPQFEEPLNNKTWLCSSSEACSLLMTSCSALIYSAGVCISTTRCQNSAEELVRAGALLQFVYSLG